jgi:hypothetical protein
MQIWIKYISGRWGRIQALIAAPGTRHPRYATALSPVSFARNLGVLFDSKSSLSDHISSTIKAYLFHIRDLIRLRPILDQTTVLNIATAPIHSLYAGLLQLIISEPSCRST